MKRGILWRVIYGDEYIERIFFGERYTVETVYSGGVYGVYSGGYTLERVSSEQNILEGIVWIGAYSEEGIFKRDAYSGNTKIRLFKYSRLSLSRNPRDCMKYFEISVEISVLRHIRFAELRKTINRTTTFNRMNL